MKNTHRIITFDVTGRGLFPIDMLRYDMSWPQSQQDVCEMDAKDRRTITLNKATHGHGPTQARWASFGWKVSNIIE